MRKTTLALAAALPTVAIGLAAHAQTLPPRPARVAQAAPAAPKVDFDIPKLALADALAEWSRQTGLQVLRRETDDALELTTHGVKGKYSPAEALERMLIATGLTYQFVNERTVRIAPARTDAQTTSYSQEGRRAAGMTLAQSSGNADMSQARNARAEGAQAGASEASTQAKGSLEEIVVTAQKRAESIQDISLSVSALSAEEIKHRGIVSSEEYLRAIPNVSLMDNGPGLNDIMIRGAYGEAFNTGPTVGVYFGEVPLTGYAIGGSADIKLIDIERVEVLRGPQGTLYGSNSLSGTLRYIPAAPDLREFSGRADTGYSRTGGFGGDNTILQGVVNVPLLDDKLAIRAVAYRHENDGFVRNVAGDDAALQADAALFGAQSLAVNEEHLGSITYEGIRVSALWKPVDALSVTLTYLNQDVSQDERAFEQRQAGAYRRSTYRLGSTIGDDDGLRIDLDILNLQLEYDFGFGTLLSSTSRVEQQFVRKWEIGTFFGSPAMPLPQISNTNAEVLVQEVRFASDFSGPLQLVGGLYYEDSEQPTRQPTYFGGDPALNPFAAVQLWDTFLDRQVTQKAAFGEISYDLTERITATVGSRFFEYDTRFIATTFNSVVVPESFADDETDESGHTLKAGLEYAVNDDALIYASWSEGFRLGRPLSSDLIAALCDTDSDGFLDGTDIPSSLSRVSSDSLESYELGGKLAFGGGRVTLNGAAYLNNWDDIPVNVAPPGCLTATVVNGGKVKARGLELEGRFKINEALRATIGFGYVDSELALTSSAGNDGDRMNFVPKLNANLGVEYGFALVGHESFVRGDYTYFGSYYGQTGERGQKADAYSLVNVSAGTQLGNVDLQFHVNNALNSDALTTIEGPGSFPTGYATRLRPRTVGVRLGYRF